VLLDIKHALNCKYARAWRKAIRCELASLHSKGTLRIENLPTRRNAIGKKWGFEVKARPGGSVDRFKARLMALGLSQRARVDYSKTFSPFVKLSTLRTVLAIAAKRNMQMHLADIETTFRNDDFQVEIYIRHPRGA
jgi:hypothetical protein